MIGILMSFLVFSSAWTVENRKENIPVAGY